MILSRSKHARRRLRERGKARHLRNFGPPSFQAFLRDRGCVVCGSRPVELAHVNGRKMGGNQGPNFWKYNLVPLCPEHHREMDQRLGRKRFEEKCGIDLEVWAWRVHYLWKEEGQ